MVNHQKRATPAQGTHRPVLECYQAIGLQQEIGTRAGLRAVHYAVSLVVALLAPGNIAAVIGSQNHGADGRGAAMALRHLIAVFPAVDAHVAEMALGLQPVSRGKETIGDQILRGNWGIQGPFPKCRQANALQLHAQLRHRGASKLDPNGSTNDVMPPRESPASADENENKVR